MSVKVKLAVTVCPLTTVVGLVPTGVILKLAADTGCAANKAMATEKVWSAPSVFLFMNDSLFENELNHITDAGY